MNSEKRHECIYLTLLQKAWTHQTVSRDEKGRGQSRTGRRHRGHGSGGEWHTVNTRPSQGAEWNGRSLKRIKNLVLWVVFSIQRISQSNFTKTRMTPDYYGTSLLREDKSEDMRRKKICWEVSAPVTDCMKLVTLGEKWQLGILTCWISVWNQLESLRLSSPHHLSDSMSHTHGISCVPSIQSHSTDMDGGLLRVNHTVPGSADSAVDKTNIPAFMELTGKRVWEGGGGAQ